MGRAKRDSGGLGWAGEGEMGARERNSAPIDF